MTENQKQKYFKLLLNKMEREKHPASSPTDYLHKRNLITLPKYFFKMHTYPWAYLENIFYNDKEEFAKYINYDNIEEFLLS